MRRLMLLGLFACGSTDVGPGDTLGVGTAAVSENVIVINGATVEEDAIVLAEGARHDIRAGDYVASAEGDGFLRRVERIEDRRLRTRPAAVAEVVANGSIEAHLELEPIIVDLSGTQIADGVSLSPLAVSLQPVIDLALTIEKHQVKAFSTHIQLARTSSVGAVANVDIERTVSTGDVKLWRSPKWRFVQWIGPVPIVEVVYLTLFAGADGRFSARAEAQGAADCTRAATYDLRYADGEWDFTDAGETDCSGTQPSARGALELSLLGYLKGMLSVDFYGLAGPYVAAREGVQADVRLCPAPGALDLSSPAAVLLGADLSKLGGSRYETTLAKHTFPIGSWPIDSSAVCR